MKKLLILLFITPLFGASQIDTSLIIKESGFSYTGSTGNIVIDSFQVIMLVSDTTGSSEIFKNGGPVQLLYPQYVYGYMVSSYWTAPEFLDKRKKPFKKSIIVWTYKIINQ